ncbi:MAG: gliding motility-associated C-terminal domain-containing protein, partial [Chitinophagaceae bacterium]
TIGRFTGTIDFDPGPGAFPLTSRGSFDIFILKLDPTGNFIWAKRIGGSGVDGAVDIKIAVDGSINFAGGFGNTVDFDPGPGVFNLSTNDPNSSASFISKLDKNGDFLWAKKFENTGITSMDIDLNGNIFACGGFYNIADFDPGPGIFNLTATGYTGLSTGIQDIFALKLTMDGDFVFAFKIGSTSSEYANRICADKSGNFAITGYFAFTADFDPSSNTYNMISDGADIFVAKYTATASLIWAKKFSGGDVSDLSYDIKADASDNLYLTGFFRGTADFDPGSGILNLISTGGNTSAFIVKLDANGNLAWAKQTSGTRSQRAFGLALDTFGNCYVTGDYEGTADFDPGANIYNLTSNGFSDIFIMKLNTDGTFAWAVEMGSTINYDFGKGITIDQSRNVYTTGHYWGTVDFDPGPGVYNLTMTGTGDAFIQKLSQCVNVTYNNVDANACTTYTLNNKTYNTSGTYTQVIKNTSGCDSIITLHLVIGGFNDTSKVTACDKYTWNGQTYSSAGFYSKTFTDRYGCDSILNLDLKLNYTIRTSINAAICEGQTYSGHTTTGVYIDTIKMVIGCDSIITLNLLVKQRTFSNLSATICEGQNYLGHTKSGIYRDTLAATNGCDSIRTVTLTVNSVQVQHKNISICKGQSYYAAGSNQTTSGIYRDTLQTYLACDSIIITQLSVNSLPVPDLGADRNICQGESVTFYPGSFISYEWQNGSMSSSFTTSNVGLYWVKVADNNNCTATDTLRILSVLPAPSNFLKAADSLCQYDVLTIKPLNTYIFYSWSTGSNNPSISVSKPGQYILSVKDINSCPGKDTIQIIQKNCYTGVYIPNAFTPNSDNLNDILKAKVYGKAISFSFKIYDGWGNLIYSSTDPQKGWDGKNKGIPSLTGVFVWQCNYHLEGSQPEFKKGTVTLIR